MHLLAEGTGVVKLCDLYVFLDEAHLHDGTDHLEGCGRAAGLAFAEGLIRVDPQQLSEFQRIIIPRSRQEMDLAAEVAGAGDGVAEGAVRRRMRDADSVRDRGHRRHGPHPDDIVYLYIVGKDGFLAAVKVEDGSIARLIDAEVIKPVAVLAELVAIIPILCRRFDIAEEKGDAGCSLCLHAANQRLTPPDINIFCEHSTQI